MAHEDRVVDVGRAAAPAVLRVGGVLHLGHRHARVLDAEVQGLPLATEVGDDGVVRVQHELLDERGRQRLRPALGDGL